MPKQITLAYSPCPNDTHLFGAIACGRLQLKDHPLEIHLHDIQELNNRALQGEYDISKVSFSCYLRIQREYRLLNVGAALGFGNGPLLLSADPVLGWADLAQQQILFPGEMTTAYLLFRLLVPESPTANHHFAPYHEIMPRVAAGEFGVGAVIHESRFTYQQQGLHRIADLGERWECETGLPLPLGCCVMRHELYERIGPEFEALLLQSMEISARGDAQIQDYTRQHAVELEADVLQSHIQLYVNRYSRDLGTDGRQAVETLRQRAADMGILSHD